MENIHPRKRSTVSFRGSVRSRQSIFYDTAPRISAADHLEGFFDLAKDDTFVLFDDYDDSIEEEEVREAEEDRTRLVDREPYYQRYDSVLEEINLNKAKNNVLQKKVSMHFKRRKIGMFLKDGDQAADQAKYYQRLRVYGEVLAIHETHRAVASGEVEDLRRKRDEQSVALDSSFKNMQLNQGNVGTGLIHTKTGRPIAAKLVERFLRRQRSKMEQVCVMRLKFIRLKDMVQEKLDGVSRLDKIDDHHRLNDYEHLKDENRSYADRIEERDEELAKLRRTCQNTIQILAHLREKSAALERDVADRREELGRIEDGVIETRRALNEAKLAKDKYRGLISKIKEDTGLLTESTLLLDMEHSKKELDVLRTDLETCKQQFSSRASQVRNLRKHIARTTEVVREKRGSVASQIKSDTKIRGRKRRSPRRP